MKKRSAKTKRTGRHRRERNDEIIQCGQRKRLADELDEIGKRCATLPVLDNGSEAEILGYEDEELKLWDVTLEDGLEEDEGLVCAEDRLKNPAARLRSAELRRELQKSK